jgi:hypothetical protein
MDGLGLCSVTHVTNHSNSAYAAGVMIMYQPVLIAMIVIVEHWYSQKALSSSLQATHIVASDDEI